jgi:branched-chain amino acid transport system substrate-binding protein
MPAVPIKRIVAPPRLAGTFLAVGVSLAVAACSGGSGSSGSTNEVLLFSVNAQTGQSAAYGGPSIQEEQLFVDWTNSKGGLVDNCGNKYQLKLQVFDMANSAEQAIAGIRQAGTSKAAVVLGPTPDTGNVPMTPVAGQLKIPYIIPAYGTHIAQWNPYTYRINSDAEKLVPIFLSALKSKVGVKSIAQIYDQTQNSQAAEATQFKAEAANLNMPDLAYEAFKAGDVDFRAQLSKIKNTAPDMIIIDAAAPEAIKIVNQAQELGITSKLYVSEAANLFPEVWDGTHGLVKGTYTGSPGAVGGNSKPNTPEAIDLYTKKVGNAPNIYGTWGWDAAAAAADAVKRACSGTDREKIRAALSNTTSFPLAAGGSVTWKNPPDGNNQTPGFAVIVVTDKGAGDVV